MDEKLLRFGSSLRICWFDFETTSLNLSFTINRPWQIGMMTMVGQKCIASHDILVKWPNPYKFNADVVKNLFKTTIPELEARINTKGIAPEKAFEIMYGEMDSADLIGGHNILGFDIYLLKEWCVLAGKPWKHLWPKFIDTNCLSKGIALGIKPKSNENFMEYQYRLLGFIQKGLKTNLTFMGKSLGIEHDYESLHCAKSDIELNIKVFDKLKYQIEV